MNEQNVYTKKIKIKSKLLYFAKFIKTKIILMCKNILSIFFKNEFMYKYEEDALLCTEFKKENTKKKCQPISQR